MSVLVRYVAHAEESPRLQQRLRGSAHASYFVGRADLGANNNNADLSSENVGTHRHHLIMELVRL